MNGPLGKKKLCENTKICAKSDSGKIMIVNIFNLFFNLKKTHLSTSFLFIINSMQLQPEQYGTIRQASRHIYLTSGFKGFFRGLAPRIVRRTLMAALAWTVYEGVMKKIGIK